MLSHSISRFSIVSLRFISLKEATAVRKLAEVRRVVDPSMTFFMALSSFASKYVAPPTMKTITFGEGVLKSNGDVAGYCCCERLPFCNCSTI